MSINTCEIQDVCVNLRIPSPSDKFSFEANERTLPYLDVTFHLADVLSKATYNHVAFLHYVDTATGGNSG